MKGELWITVILWGGVLAAFADLRSGNPSAINGIVGIGIPALFMTVFTALSWKDR